jgi:hypothetical protein
MGSGLAKEKEKEVFTELAKEYERVQNEDEKTQFKHMREKFKEKQVLWANSEPVARKGDRQHRGIHKHMNINMKFKTVAKMVGKLEAAKKNFNCGLRTIDFHGHVSAKPASHAHEHFNEVALLE